MRILHVTDAFAPDIGGIETFVDGLAGRQAAGHDVTVLAPVHLRGRLDDEPAPGYALRWTRPTGRLDPEWLSSFDVVHGHLSVLSPLTTRVVHAARHDGVPAVLSVHSLWRDRLPVVRAIGVFAGWKRAPALWAPVSHAAAEDVRRLLPQARMVVVPNAVDVAWWRAEPVVPHDGVVIASVMRLAARKRPLELVRMLSRLRSAVGDVAWRAVIVGSGPLESEVAREIRRRGLGGHVWLAGARTPSEIRALYAACDLYVAPATLESFGIAALEARSAGLPVVALRRGGVREFVQDGVDGLLRTDDEDLVAALADLVLDTSLRSSITRHNRSVAPRADWADALARFDSAYTVAADLVARPRAAVLGAPAYAAQVPDLP